MSWELDEEARNGPQLLFKWFERGFPPRTIEGDGDGLKGGYGRRLIEQALPYTLSAETTYELGSDSLYCTIRLPIKAKDEHGLD